jgi:hypothetical protein
MNERDALIAKLSTGLESVKPATSIDRIAIYWLVLSALYVVAVTHFMAPVRPNAWFQLATEKRFLLECLGGVLAISVCALGAFRAAVPGALTRRFLLLGVILMSLWLSSYLIGLLSPALELDMLGKRAHCIWETLVYALPPMALAFVLTRRFYPLRAVSQAFSFSLVAGMIPALYMQIACMYAPAHILLFHIMPGVLVGGVGVVVALMLSRRR